MGTPSVYSIHASHLTLRSSNLRSTRSMKSLRVPWYQRPILKDAYFLDTQRGALAISFYSLVRIWRKSMMLIHLPICVLFYYFSFWVFSRWSHLHLIPIVWPWLLPDPHIMDTISWVISLCMLEVLGVIILYIIWLLGIFTFRPF